MIWINSKMTGISLDMATLDGKNKVSRPMPELESPTGLACDPRIGEQKNNEFYSWKLQILKSQAGSSSPSSWTAATST